MQSPGESGGSGGGDGGDGGDGIDGGGDGGVGGNEGGLGYTVKSPVLGITLRLPPLLPDHLLVSAMLARSASLPPYTAHSMFMGMLSFRDL